jgi:hypothetical protein
VSVFAPEDTQHDNSDNDEHDDDNHCHTQTDVEGHVRFQSRFGSCKDTKEKKAINHRVENKVKNGFISIVRGFFEFIVFYPDGC